MKAFEMVFTTKLRNKYTVEKYYNMIIDCIKEFATNIKYMYDGKKFIVIRVYDTDKEVRMKILLAIIGNIQLNPNYKSLDLFTYTLE